MSIRSLGVWMSSRSGPTETQSSPGSLPARMPHSTPAWMASICGALEMPVSTLLRDVSDRFALDEGVAIPDTVPVELLHQDSLSDGPALAGRI